MIKPADLGKRIRAEILVDSNVANKLPNPIYVYTPLSAVVTEAPADPVVQGGDNGGGAVAERRRERRRRPDRRRRADRRRSDAPAAGRQARAVLSAKVAAAKIKSGAALSLKITMSEAGSLVVEYRKGKKKAASFKVAVPAGKRTVKLPKKKLARGSLQGDHHPGRRRGQQAKTVTFKVR